MTEIRPIADPHEQEALAARCRIAYAPNALAYAAFRGGVPTAICQFRLCPDGTARIVSVGCGANDCADPLLRLLTVGVASFCLQNGCTRLLCANGVQVTVKNTLETLGIGS